jgi:hypothetical protein
MNIRHILIMKQQPALVKRIQVQLIQQFNQIIDHQIVLEKICCAP